MADRSAPENDPPVEDYWIVHMNVYAFDTKIEALEFKHALVDAFCAMPLAKTRGSSVWVRQVRLDDVSLSDTIAAQAEEIERLRLQLTFITDDAERMLDALAAYDGAKFDECDAEVLCGDTRCNRCGCLVMKRDRISEARAILGETP